MSERIKFEYNIIEFPQGFKKNNIERETLNDSGRNGWELVSVTEIVKEKTKYLKYIFKRPV
jgi:hypothetical protein